MKKVAFRAIDAPDPASIRTKAKLYRIALGHGCYHTFKSYRAARDFSVRYSKEINLALHLFNHILAQIYVAHRGAWFYYWDAEKKKNSTDIEHHIHQHIHEAERELHQAIFKSTGHYTGAFSIWKFTSNTAWELQKACTLLADFLWARRLYTQAKEIRILSSQAAGEIKRLQELFGLDVGD